MAIKDTTAKIEFDPYATLADLAEAVEDLRARFGNDAHVRALGTMEFNMAGPHIASLTAHPATECGHGK